MEEKDDWTCGREGDRHPFTEINLQDGFVTPIMLVLNYMNRIWWNAKWTIPINSLEYRSVDVPSYSVHTVEDFIQFIYIWGLDLFTGYLILWNTFNQHVFDKLDNHSSFWTIVSYIHNEKRADMAELPDPNPTYIRKHKLRTSYLQYIWL